MMDAGDLIAKLNDINKKRDNGEITKKESEEMKIKLAKAIDDGSRDSGFDNTCYT